MIVGLDVGYANVKLVSNGRKVIFPSVVGTGESSSFKVGKMSNEMQIKIEDRIFNVGESALGGRSRFTTRRETRDWYKSNEYKVLIHAAFAEIGNPQDVTIVTGLPVSFFKQEEDKNALKEVFMGMHQVQRVGYPVAMVNVEKCIVAPQPMGTLADVGLNDEGQISNAQVATGNIGIIDIGGKTTNILHAEKMGDVNPSTDSFNIGGWDVVRAIREKVEELCPDSGFEDHDIAEAIKNGSIMYRGENVSIQEHLEVILDPMADEIVSTAMQLWPGAGARLQAIYISGGGANLIGEYVITKINHGNVNIVYDSAFANARGFYKLGLLQSK